MVLQETETGQVGEGTVNGHGDKPLAMIPSLQAVQLRSLMGLQCEF